MKKIKSVRRALRAFVWITTFGFAAAFLLAVGYDLAPTKVVASEPQVVRAAAPVLDSGSHRPADGFPLVILATSVRGRRRPRPASDRRPL
jgi:hypothetical protein